MRKRLFHIVLSLCLVGLVAASSCKKGPKRIPRSEFTQIVSEMLVRDQQLRGNTLLRHVGDTTLAYADIFASYGYDTDDYLYSVEHYLRDPEKFSRVFRDAAAILEKQKARVEREIVKRDWNKKYSNIYHVPYDSLFLAMEDSYFKKLEERLNPPDTAEVVPKEDTLSSVLESLISLEKAPDQETVKIDLSSDETTVGKVSVHPRGSVSNP